MSTTLIRLGLFLSALWLTYYSLRAFIVAVLAPKDMDISAFSGLMSSISSLMLGVPLIIILLWAMHNLKPFRRINDLTFASIIKGVLIVAIIGLIVSSAVYFKQSAPYLPNVSSSQFLAFIRLMDWLPYTIAELSLLAFAYLQLKSRAKGRKMAES